MTARESANENACYSCGAVIDSGLRGFVSTMKVTPRELQILSHLSAGKTNRSISRDMEISEGTVRRHLENIYRKLDVHSRIEAILLYNSRLRPPLDV
jgi:DNA-binding NarL/FixJ family response regulator